MHIAQRDNMVFISGGYTYQMTLTYVIVYHSMHAHHLMVVIHTCTYCIYNAFDNRKLYLKFHYYTVHNAYPYIVIYIPLPYITSIRIIITQSPGIMSRSDVCTYVCKYI